MHHSPARLRAARKSAGLARERVAVAVGKSYDTVVGYERGKFAPPLHTLAVMAALYGVAVEDLYEATA